jgi:hypothetical protein
MSRHSSMLELLNDNPLNEGYHIGMLSLAEATKLGRLPEFISQGEARGIGPINGADYDADAAAPIKAAQSKSRTSRSSFDDGSNEIQTVHKVRADPIWMGGDE